MISKGEKRQEIYHMHLVPLQVRYHTNNLVVDRLSFGRVWHWIKSYNVRRQELIIGMCDIQKFMATYSVIGYHWIPLT